MKLSELKTVLAALPNTVNLLLTGSPGAGKTAALLDHYSDTSRYCIIYFCPSQQEATESAGLPTIITVDGIDYCGKALPAWFKHVQDAAAAGRTPVVFVDEIDKASMSVQSALLELFGRTRSLAGVRLPENTILICAGNRAEDRSGSQKMSMALANRLMTIDCQTDANVWLAWAAEAGIAPLVRSYIAIRPENLDAFDPASKQYPSPRTWHAVSDCIHAGMGNLPMHLMLEAFTGLLGKSVGTEFTSIADALQRLTVTPEQVWANPATASIPDAKDPSALFAITTALMDRSDTSEKVDATLTYAMRMPASFAVMMGNGLYKTRQALLLKCKAYTAYTVKYGDQLAAIA